MLTITLNPALDVSATIPALEPDRKLHCSDVRLDPGGGGVNVARVAHRLGTPVVALVFLERTSGIPFVELMTEEGVPLEVVEVGGRLRESLSVVAEANGRQYRFVLPGPTMTAAELDAGVARLGDLLTPGALAVFSGSTPPGLSGTDVARLLARAAEAGARVIVDTSGEALTVAAAAGVALLKPSVRELSHVLGRELGSLSEIEQGARDLLAFGDNAGAVVSLGGSGAIIVQPDEPAFWCHAPQVRSISTIGAGDSLVAGIATALERGETVVDSVRWGVAAGSASTLATGTSLCDPDDVTRLIDEVLVTEIAR